MGTFAYASLRFPVAMAASLGITGALFWGLWSLTDHTFSLVETVPVKIDFKPLVEETLTENRRQPKVVREPPAVVPDVPAIDTVSDEQFPTVVAGFEPEVMIRNDGVTIGGGSDRDAIPLVRVEPNYPPAAAARGTEGWVLVQYDISASGAVHNVVAVESEPGTTFDKAAIDAVARWRYNPSIVNGQAIDRVGMQTIIRFNLEDE